MVWSQAAMLAVLVGLLLQFAGRLRVDLVPSAALVVLTIVAFQHVG